MTLLSERELYDLLESVSIDSEVSHSILVFPSASESAASPYELRDCVAVSSAVNGSVRDDEADPMFEAVEAQIRTSSE